MGSLRLRPSPGVLIAVIALVFAMSGAAIAAKNKIQTNDIASGAVTGKKIARDAVKSGKIADGKVKANDLAPGLVQTFAYGRVNKNGANPTVANGAVGINGVAGSGAGEICYDLATAPVSGSATIATDNNSAGSTVTLLIGAGGGCAAPFNDAKTTTTSSPTVDTSPYQEGSPANRDVYVQFIGG